MTETSSSQSDRSGNSSLEKYTHFKKEEFEVDWEKISDRSLCQVYKVKLKLWRENCAIKTFSSTDDYRNMAQAFKIGKTKFKYLISNYGLCRNPTAIVMEYMNKGSLDNLLASHVLMWPKKFQMIHEVTMGMNFLHSMKPPVLHLNLKLSNIMLDDHLHVKISDFGLIGWEESKKAFVEDLSARGNISYVPPEAFTQNPEPPTTKYDVYSFSIVMWEILTQKRPYSGMNMTEILIRVSSGKRPSVEKIPDDKPQECEDMIDLMQQCWDQDCSHRPAFSETVWMTEALSDVLKIPDLIPGSEKTKQSFRLRTSKPIWHSRGSNDSTDGRSDSSGQSIHTYLEQKDFESFKNVLRKEHVSMFFRDNNSLLHHAASSGDVESVQMVLNLGASVNCQSVRGYTALIVALLRKFYDICTLLTDHGADVNLGDQDLWTPLHFAVQGGDDRAVRMLLDNKAAADSKDKDGWTPLHLAAQNGHEGVVRLLLPRLASVDEQEEMTGRTALHMACMYGYLNIGKLLLAKGADPNKTDADQATALHLAAEEGHFRVARLLLTKEAEVNAVNGSNYSALHYAALRGCTGICRLLLNHGANPNVRTNQKWTPMHLAALKGHPETVLVLEENKGSMDARGEGGWTPLHLACHHMQEEVVAVLLTAGANPNLSEDSSWTPLHMACHKGAFPSTLQLIAKQADINAQNISQDTPLHLAVQAGSTPIVKALLMNGAQRHIVNSRGCTALALAQQQHNKEIVQLLDS
ncbi:ankyrin repeat and protein kinase domain-containing protein 1 [Salminus brasiliensis]|uniref:ankyrin repeat and protein kinase domain-containing protein 1 n=1 Tax=Salminus brasiliensis TaxID=930266 RepID=UPI003B838244